MHSILDQVAAQTYSAVCPQTAQDYFGLQLARKLNDAEAARHYIELAHERSEESLVVAFRSAVSASENRSDTLAKNFHAVLNQIDGTVPAAVSTKLLALKVERRTVSAAILHGRRLEDVATRHLSSSHAKAEASTASFVRWLVASFEIESAAMEVVHQTIPAQRTTLDALIADVLTEQAVPLQRVPKAEFIVTFGHPQTESRREVREVVKAIWPILETDPGILDAVALGLYVQTERLFAEAL